MNCHYSSLEAWARSMGYRRWGPIIKMHYAMHIAIQARVTNPRFGWTYMDEDFMGLLKQIAESCAKGTPAQGMVLKLCERYVRGIDFRWSRALLVD